MRAPWQRQAAAILRFELRKNAFGARALPLYLLALLPVGLLALMALLAGAVGERVMVAELFAGVFRVYYLKVAIFIGCLWLFIQLFRGDMLDRSLHYYFLCPVRREVLAAAKYAAGVVTTAAVLMASVAASYLLASLAFSAAAPGQAGRPGHLLAYLGITLLACLGYGAVFMLAGLFFRNPIVPAAALFLWEFLNPFLPALLKKISVVHYLVSLLPVPLTAGPFEILTDPTPAWLSVPGLLLVTAAALTLAGLRIRTLEIRYGDE